MNDRINVNDRKRRFFFPDKPTSGILIRTIAGRHKKKRASFDKETTCIASGSILAVRGTPRNVHAVSTTRVRDFFPDGDRGGKLGRREQERSPRIKSARIKNASSETSYSRFLPVVGINRPFRRRCINRDRGRATFLRPTLVAATPPGVE